MWGDERDQDGTFDVSDACSSANSRRDVGTQMGVGSGNAAEYSRSDHCLPTDTLT